MAEQHDRILGYFLEEASEQLITIEQGLHKLAETLKQPTALHELYRAAHSIKGSAAMLGIPTIQQIGNQFETNFKLLQEQPEIAVDDKLQSLFLRSFSLLKTGIDEVRRSSNPYHQDPTTLNLSEDPVFAELKSYLQHLVTNLNSTLPTIPELEFDNDPNIERVLNQNHADSIDGDLLLNFDDSNNFGFLDLANPISNNNELELNELIHLFGNDSIPDADTLDFTEKTWFDEEAFANLNEPIKRENIVKALDPIDVNDIWSNTTLAPVQPLEQTIELDLSQSENPQIQTALSPPVNLVDLPTPIESDDRDLHLSIPPVDPDRNKPADLNPDYSPELSQQNSDIWGINTPVTDPIASTELNSRRVEDYILTTVTPSPTNTQSLTGDNALEAPVNLFASLDLDVLDDNQPTEHLTVDELTGFDFERTFASELTSFDSERTFVHELPAHSSPTDDFEDFDLEFLNGIAPIAESPRDNVGNLDLDMKINENDRHTSTIDDFTDLNINLLDHKDLDLNPVSAEGSGSDFDNLNLNEFLNLSLDELGADESSSPRSTDLEFADLDLNIDLNNAEKLSLQPADPNSHADFDFDLGTFGSNESNSGLSVPSDLPELDFTSLTDLHANTSTNSDLSIDSDLNIFNNNLDNLDFPDAIDVNAYGDFADLNLNNLNDRSFNDNELSSSEFNELSELNFNLDNLDSNLSNNELTDLESMLESSVPPLPQDGNLEHTGDLDTLLGITALGMSGTVLIGDEAFTDLDNLLAPEANLDDLDGLLAPPTPTPIIPPTPAPKTDKTTDRKAKQSRTFEQTMRVSVRHLDNLNNLVGELVVNRNTLEQDQNRMRQFIDKLLSEVQKLNEVGKRMQDLYERSLMENSLVASRQQYKSASPSAPPISNNLDENGTLMEYDPLEMDRFTPIHLLSQKMIELTVRVRESTADIEFVVDGSTEVTRTLRQITGQLQEDLTKSRMIPFAQTADRLQRGVRDNGLKYGKQIDLNVEGRDTLIDKVILESLTEPLIHMVNNAIAHGIETPETRLAAGKSSNGKVTIRAIHQGNQTIISISDDGAGIDTERVMRKAIEKGIITIDQAAVMPKSEAYELLFLPSFSTKDQADELAGRGVGMDVVKTSIAEIRGTITTESQLGVGTIFTIRLPLALSIAKALIAVNNKSNIAFPMDGIEDTKNVSPEEIQTNDRGESCILWREELMPFKPLTDLLTFNRPLARNNFYTTQEDESDLVSILILRSDGILAAVQVDKITGDQEIVIKPLQGPAAKPLGIAGATVMGDGRIIPIADVMELIALAKGTLVPRVPIQWLDKIATPVVEVRESMVLIVDDSITVRELLSLTFKRAGYRVEQARDGQEAWDKLRAGLPCDIVFCDIEMPRMDGLEFLSRIQKDVALKKLPIAMLTSRGSDRHRQIASQLGASGYFIKPYLEEALLDAAKRMIKGEILQIV